MKMKRVKSFGDYQTSKVAAIIMFCVSLLFIIPLAFISSFMGSMGFPGFPFGGGLFFLIMPFLYGIMGFVMTAISCLIYNLISKWTGGIEVEIETVDESTINN